MKKIIIASLAAACAVPFANAGTLYNTMDPMTTFDYKGYLSPPVTFNSTNIRPVVDDVSFGQNVNITSFSCRILTTGAYEIHDIVKGYLYIIDTVSGLPFEEVVGLDDGLFDFEVTDVSPSIDFEYNISIDLKQPLSQNLSAGKYWFGVLLEPSDVYYNFAGNHYGMGDNTMVFNGNWNKWSTDNGEGTDLSMRIEGDVLGEPSVPGPAAILPFGIGLAAAIRRRRK